MFYLFNNHSNNNNNNNNTCNSKCLSTSDNLSHLFPILNVLTKKHQSFKIAGVSILTLEDFISTAALKFSITKQFKIKFEYLLLHKNSS